MESKSEARPLLPNSIKRIIAYARDTLKPRRVILFGSRARGEGRRDSDFDLAFVLDPATVSQWPRFVFNVREGFFTLHALDLVEWSRASEELRQKVSREGVVVYER